MANEDGPPPAASTEVIPGDSARHLVNRVRLRVADGPDQGKVHEASGERILVGEHESNDFQLADPRGVALSLRDRRGGGRAAARSRQPQRHRRRRRARDRRASCARARCSSSGASGCASSSRPSRTGCRCRRGNALRQAGRRARWRCATAFALLERARRSRTSTVLLEGETGTGKERRGRGASTRASARRDGPFVVVDCGAIPPNLLESELFGHEKGAFTGADARRVGAFEAASGGTIFLDEIGELAQDLQPKLLARARAARGPARRRPTRYAPIDVRVVAATNRDLRAEVNARPLPLRSLLPARGRRGDDCRRCASGPRTSRCSVERILRATRAPTRRAGGAAHARVPRGAGALAWPGNVRELRNYLERCLALQAHAPPAEHEAPTAGADGRRPSRRSRRRASAGCARSSGRYLRAAPAGTATTSSPRRARRASIGRACTVCSRAAASGPAARSAPPGTGTVGHDTISEGIRGADEHENSTIGRSGGGSQGA